MTCLTKSYNYVTSVEELELVIADLKEYKKAFPNKRMRLALDLETYWTDDMYKVDYEVAPLCIRTLDDWEGRVRIIALGLDPELSNKQYLIDAREIGQENVTKYLKEVLEKDAVLIGQNLSYDLPFLALQYDIYAEKVRDTMLIAQLRWRGDKLLHDNTDASFKLSALYNRCIPLSLFINLTGKDFKAYEDFKAKHQKEDWGVEYLSDSQLDYSADDVRLIFYVYDSLIKECNAFIKRHRKSGLKYLIDVECDNALEYGLMKAIGVGFDADYHKNELIPYLEQKADEAEEKLVRIKECWIEVQGPLKCPKKNPHYEPKTIFINPASSDQLGRALTENLGFTLPKTETGKLSCTGEILNELFWRAEPGKARDVLELILQYRKAKSFLSKNGENSLHYIHEDGRVHPSIYQMGSDMDSIDTGRSSAKNPAIMTIPARDKMFHEEGKTAFELFRRSYIPADDHVLIGADFSNEEVRVITEFSGDSELTRLFKANADLHQNTADNIGLDRDGGKLFFLASQYGAKEKKIQKTLYEDSGGIIDLPLERVKELREDHFKLYNGLARKIKESADYIEKQLEPFNSLTEFINRRPLVVGFTPVFGAHRTWCLTREQEFAAYKILKEGKEDTLHRRFLIKNDENSQPTTWNNEFNKRKGAIIREYFNFLVQAECAVVLKVAIRNIGLEFRKRGWNPYDAQIVIPCHDELVADVRKDLAQEAKQIIHDCMYNALCTVLKKVPTVISIHTGTSWMGTKAK